MESKEEIICALKQQMPYLHQKYGVDKLALFGSFAKGNASRESDVDLVVEFNKTPGLRFMELAQHIEKTLGKKVDLLTPEGVRHIRVPKSRENIKKQMQYV
ncbi:MAG: nucleotidyltransferase [Candidatus Altiarchaeales archaeon]|nr:nucleotidyltransferase [Candidatus Altiarchaeales archaeon]